MPRQDGILYFLPRQLVRVTAKRTEKTLSDAIKAVGTKQDALREAEAAVADIKAAIKATENAIIAASGGDAAKKILADRLTAQMDELAEAKTAKSDAEKAFEKAKADLKETILALKRSAEAAAKQKQVEAAKIRVETLKAEIVALASIVEGTPPGGSFKQVQELGAKRFALEETKRYLEATTNVVSTAKSDTVQVTNETPKPLTPDYSVTLKIDLQAPSADPAQAFRLDPTHSALRDDEHKITVSPAGLLNTADITAIDRTGDIVVEIATFAGAIARLGVGGGGPFLEGNDNGDKSGEKEKPEDRCKRATDDYIGLVDFADAESVKRMNKDLQCLGVRVKAEGTHWPADTRPTESRSGQGVKGIVYRVPVEVQLSIERCTDPNAVCANPSDWFTTEMIALALPQAGPISFIQQRAGIATKTKYASVFKDGILTSYEDNRPSEALNIAQVPLRALNGIFEGFSKIISLRTGQTNALAGLSTSQLALLNAQSAYQTGQIDSQRKLSDAERTLLEARIALQAAATNGEKTLTEAQIALLEKQVALQTGQLNGQASLAEAQLSLLQKQAGLTLGANTLQTQLSASELALAIALLRDRAKTQTLNQCIADRGANAIDVCLP
ncbi:MAG: hypothetical protein K2X59_09975 [Sphingomonas sp.]|nr:hypothetical protein [Sphingomonas sp.]